ncbi:hypothetical protein CI102_13272 [Trichoderma harzianum]|nr:hypothetical protein CI102_13272 [Trichoderma harzianum]
MAIQNEWKLDCVWIFRSTKVDLPTASSAHEVLHFALLVDEEPYLVFPCTCSAAAVTVVRIGGIIINRSWAPV